MLNPLIIMEVLEGSVPSGAKELGFFFLLDGTFLMAEPEFINSIEDPEKGITIPDRVDHFFLDSSQGAFLLKLVEGNRGKDIVVKCDVQPGIVWILPGLTLSTFLDSFHTMMDEDVRERLAR